MKQLILLPILLFTFTNATAQNTLTLDFSTKNFTTYPSDRLKPGDLYSVEISNINTNLYKISINNRDSVIDKEVKVPDFSVFSLDNLTSLIASIPKSTTLKDAATESDQKTFKIADLALAKSSLRTNPEIAEAFEVAGTITDAKVIELINQEDVRKQLAEERKHLSAILVDLQGYKKRIEDINISVVRELLSGKVRVTTDQAAIRPGNALTPGNLLTTMTSLQSEIQTKQTDILTKFNDYISYSEKHLFQIQSKDSLKVLDAVLRNSYTVAMSAADSALKSLNSAKVNEFVSALIYNTNNNFTYKSLPIQYKGQQSKVTINITPLKDEYLLSPYTTEYAFPLVRNYYFGISSSFYISGLYNEYFTTVLNVDSTYTLLKENSAKAEPGIAALLKLGKKFVSNGTLGGHLLFGPGISIGNTLRPRVLAGAGLSVGKVHMLTIDGGIIGGYVDRMSEHVIPETETYNNVPETIAQLKGSWFFSIGYLFKL